ncbi:hypothetical protein Ahy_A06g030146 [Arachis hypogaea]|uniref:CCHC-type domain-containing protein n=1 Tax=Arachis hypogaea TaxID=3818 RepID=A0A445CVD7_ARAHY|nr:hypothetical protein Ahy_A06g030146 [Arachis hypogaea]
MLKIDELTSIHSRRKFARIYVKIDLEKKIVPSFTALEKGFKLKYEGLYQICFKCGRYGHRMKNAQNLWEKCSNKGFRQPRTVARCQTTEEEKTKIMVT